ncbi:DUF485 domain-containing protein [Acetobacter sp. TBRC 12305]|uniref:DUF485 domain-containing protein n=1 Tax=Acetobacter garciniae TaxID=2817435 RepID=A0A939KNY0_9PROT|nr:DUF485 domain-containing protein [Acetobacter garciniae]MBO1326170.1 DUF485 domain-containing protein [Acetobacter garciniae]MBX0345086.1 DUF485 domain-containing protein [Acetobacter garciniae]
MLDYPRESKQAPQKAGKGPDIILVSSVSVAYYGFLFAGILVPAMLASPAVLGIPWSFLLGASLLIFLIVSTGIYVLVSNAQDGHHDG